MPHGATQSAEGSLRFSVDQDGRITHVAPELLDEVATVIWDSCVVKGSEGYRDDFPYADLGGSHWPAGWLQKNTGRRPSPRRTKMHKAGDRREATGFVLDIRRRL